MNLALLACLRCPATRQPLRWATIEELAALRAAQAAGRLHTWLDRREVDAFANCVVCETGKICYPVRDGMPVLLKEEAFTLPDN
ncbi:MAG TPA: Trm112 family protein [Chthoniobacterales bacterium]